MLDSATCVRSVRRVNETDSIKWQNQTPSKDYRKQKGLIEVQMSDGSTQILEDAENSGSLVDETNVIAWRRAPAWLKS